MKTVLALLSGVLIASSCATPARLDRQVYAMGTQLEVSVKAGDRLRALQASEAVLKEVETVEARLSNWRVDSELSRLNASAAGQWFRLTPELAEDLRQALDWAERTDFSFHPGLGKLIELWGVRSSEGQKHSVRPVSLRRALAVASASNLKLTGDSVMRLHPDFQLESGGFGKGIALDRAARMALSSGADEVRMNFGGQVLLAGRDPGPTPIRVAHPLNRDAGILEIRLTRGSLSTSGPSERGAHILDPRTGRPVTRLGSVTVWAADATTADCLSTAFQVLGPEATFQWLQKSAPRPDVHVVFAEADDKSSKIHVRASCELQPDLVVVDPRIQIEYVCPTEERVPS